MELLLSYACCTSNHLGHQLEDGDENNVLNYSILVVCGSGCQELVLCPYACLQCTVLLAVEPWNENLRSAAVQ